MPNYLKVNSSWVDSIAYENGNLYVLLRDGDRYIYYNVSQLDYSQLLNPSISVGTYINERIKPNYREDKLN